MDFSKSHFRDDGMLKISYRKNRCHVGPSGNRVTNVYQFEKMLCKSIYAHEQARSEGGPRRIGPYSRTPATSKRIPICILEWAARESVAYEL